MSLSIEDKEALAEILQSFLTSPNALDANWEEANIVDALDKVGRGAFAQAKALDRIADALHDANNIARRK